MADENNAIGGGVQLIDPMKAIVPFDTDGTFNVTPSYEDMFIFAELVANRRSRSVIVSSGEVITGSKALSDIKINLMGVDQSDPNNPKSTDRWSDNVGSNATQYEGFGIKNIDVTIDSSYIPRITIEFVDIRGLVFFNFGKKSPYSVLFDFPPPLFDLTLKGYYGKSLTYQLHLVRTNTKFDSKTGNFYITVDFVARTFAPLSDVPFKYVDLLPITYPKTTPPPDEKTLNPKTNIDENKSTTLKTVAPTSVHDLIKKLQSLYESVVEIKNTSKESKAISDAEISINEATNTKNTIQNFKNLLRGTAYSNGNTELIMYNDEEDLADSGGNIRVIPTLAEYDDFLVTNKKDGVDLLVNTKLMLAVKLYNPSEKQETLETEGSGSESTFSTFAQKQSLDNNVAKELNTLVKEVLLKDTAKMFVRGDTDIKDAIKFTKENPVPFISDEYMGLDVSVLYMKLTNFILEKTLEKQIQVTLRDDIINTSVLSELGMQPTAYNIFKIICDDIDNFFNILRNTSNSALKHHETNANLIIDNVEETRVGAFPLYIKEQIINKNKTQTRQIPTDLSNVVVKAGGEEFPEITLINDFIKTFIKVQKEELVDDLREQKDGDDNNVWIPLSPIDSQLINTDYSSPYNNIERQYGNLGNDDLILKIYNKILERFYVASQYTFNLDFYKLGDTSESRTKELIILIADAEATNIANSLIDGKVINLLIQNVKQFKNKPDDFYAFLTDKNVNAYNNVNDVYLNLGSDVGRNYQLYNNPNDENYTGFELIDDEIVLRPEITGENLTDPIEIYLNDDSFWTKVKVFLDLENEKPQYNTNNIIYTPDFDRSSEYVTRFLYESVVIDRGPFGVNTQVLPLPRDSYGFINHWGKYLEEKDAELKIMLKNNTISTQAKAFWIVSNFGGTRSYYDNEINKSFQLPSVIDVPKFSSLYMGGLVLYNEGGITAEVNDIYTTYGLTRDVDLGRITDRLERDSESIKTLSSVDSDKFKSEFNRYVGKEYPKTVNTLTDMLDTSVPNYSGQTENEKIESYEILLKDSDYSKYITEELTKKQIVANYNQITFNTDYVNDNLTAIPYQSLSELNADGTKTGYTNQYFNAFFAKLETLLRKQDEKITNIDNQLSDSIDDNDIKTQMYYSFKSIADKWISGDNDTIRGFPLNNAISPDLIDKFVFVDRAMNPIGDSVMLNVDSLIELSEDYDASMFTVISRLLSLNGFEFFPLQNFMSFKTKDWADSFKIDTKLDATSSPAFVCMYIGGTSTYLNNSNSLFDDDGIIDLEGEGITDFTSNSTDTNLPEVSKTFEKFDDERFPYSSTRAFRVRFAEQNQSLFKSITLDSREYPETNESLQILSQIAADNTKTAPIPKGQNLFNLYETRSYKSKVAMLGNMMIQPTQYFQLENIPMYSGAYIVLKVVHNIVPNHMTTTFEGVRVLKYPNPIVTDFLTSVGIETNVFLTNPYSGEKYDEATSRLKDSGLYEKAEMSGMVDLIDDDLAINTNDTSTNENIETLHPLIQKRAEAFIKEAASGYVYQGTAGENNDIVVTWVNGTSYPEDAVVDLNGNVFRAKGTTSTTFVASEWESIGLAGVVGGNGYKTNLRITSGFRSFDEQLRLYNQGRIPLDTGSYVTRAKPGFSYHNYGLSFDLVELNGNDAFDDIMYGKESNGVFKKPKNTTPWVVIAELGKKHGFDWGGDWTSFIDRPHFEERYHLSTAVYRDKIVKGVSIQGYPIVTKAEQDYTP